MAQTAFPSLSHLWESFLDLLFPPRCIVCRRANTYLCGPCRGALPRVPRPQCRRCGTPWWVASAICGRCQSQPLALEAIRSPFLLEGPLRAAVHAFKYRSRRALAPLFGELLWEYLREEGPKAETIVPVPLHPRRLRSRGYNQAALLARELGRRAGLPVVEGLERVRDTPQQTLRASAEARRENVAGAFRCLDVRLEGKSVLLLDDVMTTGATLDAAAEALLAAKVARVWGLTLAREL